MPYCDCTALCDCCSIDLYLIAIVLSNAIVVLLTNLEQVVFGKLAEKSLSGSWQNTDYSESCCYVTHKFLILDFEKDEGSSHVWRIFYYVNPGTLFPSHQLRSRRAKVSFMNEKRAGNVLHDEHYVLEFGRDASARPFFTVNARDDVGDFLSVATHVLFHNFVFFCCTLPQYSSPLSPTGYYFLSKSLPGQFC